MTWSTRGGAGAAGSPPILTEVLRRRAAATPNRPLYLFLDAEGREAESLTFGELDLRARAVAARLQSLGAAGERALLLFPPGLDFLAAFWGCLYAGVIAVPAYPPRSQRSQPRLRAVAADSRATLVLSCGAGASVRRMGGGPAYSLASELPRARWIATDELPREAGSEWRDPGVAPGDAAFLQYTSGSTAEPKGVVVTHAGLAHNEEMIQRAFGQSEGSVVVGWLPLYHDMGLIGNALQPVWCGGRAILMAPLTFLQRPVRWLEAISRYRASTSGGPSFAYELCARRVSREELDGLDLASWEVAFNGAEPVRAETLRRFSEAFAPCGFAARAFYPCYGLAEATLFVSGGEREAPPLVRTLQAEALAHDRVAEAQAGERSADLVSCGRVWGGQRLEVVLPESSSPCAPGQVGEIWLAGASLAAGYFGRPEETFATFAARLADGSGPFLRTGDLGFVSGGELFVTGRLKDLIILRGRNHYPQDIERTAESAHPEMRAGCGAAFGVEREGEERLVVVQEVEHRHRSPEELADLAEELRRAVAEEHEVAVEEAVLLRSGTILKTSSGKVRRRACRDAYLAGELVVVARCGRAPSRPDAAAETPPAAPPTAAGSAAAPPGPPPPEGVEQALREETGRVLRLAGASVPSDRPLVGLGLDSLGAVELRGAVQERFGVEVPLSDLLGGATLAEVASQIRSRAAEWAGGRSEPGQKVEHGKPREEAAPLGAAARPAEGQEVEREPGVGRAGVEPVPPRRAAQAEPAREGRREREEDAGPEVPVSAGQRALWLAERMAPGSAAYNLAAAARVQGRLDAPALSRALGALTARHPALRTTFEARDGEPRGRLRGAMAVDFAVMAGGAEGAAPWGRVERPGIAARAEGNDEEAAALAELAAEAFRPFDLAQGPLLRVRVRPLAAPSAGPGADGDPSGPEGRPDLEAGPLLLLAIHHLAADFWSLAHLLRELGALYAQEAGGAPAGLPPLTLSPAEAFRRQRQHAEARSRELWGWWRDTLAGELPVLDLPTDRPRPAVLTYAGAARTLRLPAATAERVRAAASAAQATLQTALLAGFQALLHRYSGQAELLTGIPTLGRGAPGLSQVVGYFVNPVPVPSSLLPETTGGELLARVREAVLGALGHADLPFPLLVERLQPERDPGRPPLVQAIFALQPARRPDEAGLAALALGQEGTALRLGGLELAAAALPELRVPCDLTLMMAEAGGSLAASLQFNTGLFDPVTAERMLAHFGRLLAAVAGDPAARIADLDLLSEAERGQLAAWSRTPAAWLGTGRAGSKGLQAGGTGSLHGREAGDVDREAGCIHELIGIQAAGTPGRTALVRGEVSLTYGELWQRSGRLARRLAARGVGPEVRVGLFVGRSPELVVAMLGVLRAGGAYVPLDPAYPAARLSLLIEDSQASLVLVAPELAQRLPAALRRPGRSVQPGLPGRAALSTGGAGDAGGDRADRTDGPAEELLLLELADRAEGAGAGVSEAEPALAAPDPSNLAYLIYTSGSTGRPKAVALEHRGAAALARWAREVYTPEELAGVLAVTSVSFDVSVFELLVPLCWGGRVVIAENVLELPRLPAALDLRLVTAVPSALAELLAQGFTFPPSVSTVNLPGEAVPGQLVEDIYRAGTVRRVVNLYGPSEDTTFSTFALLPPRSDGRPPIGLPVAGGAAHLLAGLPGAPGPSEVPLGARGEVYLGGLGLARGYFGRPELTAERFIPSPLAGGGDEPGARLYRTGDLARRRPDGALDFLGRSDHQLKIRGVRVELGEIEAALARLPAVRAAAALALPAPTAADSAESAQSAQSPAEATGGGGEAPPRSLPPGPPSLVAFVVPRADDRNDLAPEALRAALRGSLPEALVPAAFVVLPSLPLGPNGKLDRRALARLAPLSRPGAAPWQAPATPHEALLAEIWGEVLAPLGVARVGAADDFFALGGHSLLASRVQARVAERLGADLPLAEFFQAPTLAALAARLAAAAAAGPGPVRLPRDGRDFPLSFAQERLWFLHRLEPGSAAYHMAAGLHLAGELDPGALRHALGELAARHEALRTRYPERAEGRPVQEIGRGGPRLPVVCLAGLPEAVAREEMARLALAEARRPFDLAAAAPWRALLLREGERRHTLLLTLHHIAADEASLVVLVEELAALLAQGTAARRGHPSALGEPPLQAADFAVWQRGLLSGGPSGDTAAARLGWWEERLAGLAAVELPCDRSRPGRQGEAPGGLREATPAGGRRGHHVAHRLPPALHERLLGLARSEGATLFAVLLGAFQALLARWGDLRQFPVGCPVSARSRRELERVVGLFVNTLVLRADLAGDPGLRELVARTRAATAEAHAHEVPFELLVQRLRPEREAGRTPLFDAAFTLHRPPPGRRLPALSLAPFATSTGTAKFDLTLFAIVEDGGLSLAFEAAADLFDATTVVRLLGQLETLLGAVAADPARPIWTVPLLGEAERHQLLREWGTGEPRQPFLLPVHRLVARQAELSPEAPAVSSGAESLTYRQLAARAGRLAGELRERGVGREIVVAVALERSAASVVAALAVLEAGGAYLPLDPSHPVERLAATLADARARLVFAGDDLARALVALWAAAREQAEPVEPPDHGGRAGRAEPADWTRRVGEGTPGFAPVEICTLGPGGAWGDPPQVAEGRPEPCAASIPQEGAGAEQRTAAPLAPLVPLAPLENGREEPGLLPEDLAYVIYTSGSTGAPKGVGLSHGGLANLVAWHLRSFGVGPEDRAAMVAGAGFDAAVWEVWPYLAAGASLHAPDEEVRTSPAALLDWLARHRITLAFLPTPLAEAVMALQRPEGLVLRALATGGDRLHHAPAPGSGWVVVNHYGPTECTVVATREAVPERPRGGDGPAPGIGRPIAGTRVVVVDSRGETLPAGVAGELLVGGAGLARGYLRRPDLTAERFVPDPMAPMAAARGARGEPGARLYRTGDRVRWLAGGSLEFLGRVDRQIKVRGFRLEPGEVEAALTAHPDVSAAAVTARQDDAGPVLVGCVVVRPAGAEGSHQPPSDAELRAWLRRRLPEPMVPAVFVRLAALSLTANGKVDRAALSAAISPGSAAVGAGSAGAPELATMGGMPARIAPRTDLERGVAAVWAEVLELPAGEVGAEDDFFAAGGHSLLAPRLGARLRQSFGVQLPLRVVFDRPTVAGLAAAVAEALAAHGQAAAAPDGAPDGAAGSRRDGAAPESSPAGQLGAAGPPGSPGPGARPWSPPPIETVPRRPPPPLAPAQQRLWFLEQLEPGSPLHNLPAPLLLEGELDPAALRFAFERVVARHEALRTTFPVAEGRPVQVVQAAPAVPLPLVDLAGLDAPPGEAECLRLARADALRPFDLERAPLLRTTLLRLGPQRHALLLNLHHIAADGHSLGILLHELALFYRSAALGLPAAAAPADPANPENPETSGAGTAVPPAELAPLAVQYPDYAVWQRRRLEEGAAELAAPLAWWRQRLAGAPAVLRLPLDRPRPALQSFRGGSRRLELPAAEVAALRALGRRQGASLFMVLLAVFSALLRRLTHQSDLVLGTPTASRPLPELAPLIGFFANNLVLRLDLGGDPPLAELVSAVREAALASYRQEIPFELLLQELRPERDLSHSPFYQVVFALAGGDRPDLALPGLRLTPIPAASGTAKFDLALYMDERREGLAGLLEYSADLFDATTASRILKHFAALAREVAHDAARRLFELPLLDAAERHQALLEANDTALAPHSEPFVHGWIAARAAERPAAPAVSGSGRTLSYGELDRRANQLAHRLVALGAGVESRVAVALERSPELIVAMLGIWKAGAAYVPLDPAYPGDRLAAMLADCRAAVVLSDAASTPRLPPSGIPVLLLDAAWSGLGGEPVSAPAVALRPENLVYVIYTSGSTGRPKGVMIQHGALASYTRTASLAYGVTCDDRVLQFCSVSFDISIEEIVPCLTRGAELVLRTDAMLESIPTFLDTCRAWGLTMLSLPTAYWHEIAARLDAETLALPPALRLVVIAGERALPERLLGWRRHAPERPRLINTYGLTESTIISTVGDLTACAADGRREVPIGRVIADSELYVLDPALAPVPLGVPGELFIGGGLLARGYLGMAAATADRFVPHPFCRPLGRPGARLYRTGDLARILPGGELEFLGRDDQQIKIRGYRIEIGEIEAALARHPAVAAVAVGAPEVRQGERRLVACVVAEAASAAPAAAELRSFLAGSLPEYMVPAVFLPLESLPMTPNGKVDRAALFAGSGGDGGEAGRPGLALRELSRRGVEEGPFAAPRDETERALSEIWREALGVARVGIHENFFDLGGHSLLLIRVHEAIKARFGRTVAMVDLFRHPTIDALARHLSRAEGDAAAAAPGEPAAAAGGPVAERVKERSARTRSALSEERFLQARRKLGQAEPGGREGVG